VKTVVARLRNIKRAEIFVFHVELNIYATNNACWYDLVSLLELVDKAWRLNQPRVFIGSLVWVIFVQVFAFKEDGLLAL